MTWWKRLFCFHHWIPHRLMPAPLGPPVAEDICTKCELRKVRRSKHFRLVRSEWNHKA